MDETEGKKNDNNLAPGSIPTIARQRPETGQPTNSVSVLKYPAKSLRFSSDRSGVNQERRMMKNHAPTLVCRYVFTSLMAMTVASLIPGVARAAKGESI